MQLWRTDASGNPVSLLRTGRSSANGCGTFYNTPSNVYLRAAAQYNTPVVNSHFHHDDGMSPRWALPGSGTANLGTGYVFYRWSI